MPSPVGPEGTRPWRASPPSFATLSDLLATSDFPHVGSSERPERESVRAVQDTVQRGLAGGDLFLDCIALQLDAWERGQAFGAGLVPFARHPEAGVRFAFGFWPPGAGIDPHEHTDWTVTAVCHNALEVRTFEYDVAHAEDRLVQRSLFPAPRGRAGHIYEPCIHAPRNPTRNWSISLHVTSPRDGARPRGASEDWTDDWATRRRATEPRAEGEPRSALVRCWQRRTQSDWHRALVGALSEIPGPRAVALLERVFLAGNVGTKQLVCRGLEGLDSVRAAALDEQWRRDLAMATNGIARTEPDLALEVRLSGAFAELVAPTRSGALTLLVVGESGEHALDLIARERRLLLAELPADLGGIDLVDLARALEDSGAFQVTHGAHPHE